MRSSLCAFPILVAALAVALAACNSELSPRADSSPAAFVVESIVPEDGAIGVRRGASIELRFSSTIDRESTGLRLELLPDLVVVERIGGAPGPVAGAYLLDTSDTRIVFTPDEPLAVPAVEYRIDVFPGLRNLLGQDLELDGGPVPLPSRFTTEDFADPVPPSFAGITGLETVSSTTLRASWPPATDNVSGEAEIFYRVYRNDPPDRLDVDFSTPDVVTAPEALEALIIRLAPDTEYTVAVRAVDGFGNESGNTETLSARTARLPPDEEPPVFSGVQTVSAVSASSLRVQWQSATDNRDSPGQIRYQVFVGTSTPLSFDTPRVTTDFGAAETIVGGLDPDTLHAVAVRAVDTSENVDDNTRTLEQRTLVSFAANVFPIFSSPTVGGCVRAFCHSGTSRAGGLSLANYASAMAGGRTPNPPSIVPGNASGSLLIWRIDESSPNFRSPRMPLGRAALSASDIGVVRRWIDQGAPEN